MPEVLPKVRALRDLGFAGEVSIDGGVNLATISECARAGVNVFVAGTAVFGAENRAQRVGELRQLADKERLAGGGDPR